MHAESQRGQDGQFVCGVRAGDVEPGVGLRKAEPLRVGEGVGEGLTGFQHFGKDVVARPVNDPVEGLDAIGDQTVLDRPGWTGQR